MSEHDELGLVCRPITVDVDGQQVHAVIHGSRDATPEEQAMISEIVAAAVHKFQSEHHQHPEDPA